MLSLLTFPASFEMPSHSPFCVKAMVLLNLSGADWTPEYLDDPRPMPMGRLPVLRVGARLIPDTAWIQDYLVQGGADLWGGQGDTARHAGIPLIRMAEATLYQSLVHDRWMDARCWPQVRETFFASIPRALRGVVTSGLRKKVGRALAATGVSQFDEAGRVARIRPDLDALKVRLREGPYLLGPRPTAADAAVAPVLAMIAALPGDTGLRREMRGRLALMDYTARMRPHWHVPPA